MEGDTIMLEIIDVCSSNIESELTMSLHKGHSSVKIKKHFN